jgi:hypothetical protein
MRCRRWISWLAVAAILLHTATVARHNVIRFQAIPAELAALAGFEPGFICHIDDSEADEAGQAQALPGKDQGGVSKPCPVCLGLASAHALPASDAPALRVPQTIVAADFILQDPGLAPAVRFSHPLNRGPPGIG